MWQAPETFINNTGPGIELNNSDFQFVLGNLIGLNVDGTSTLPNGIGVLLTQTAQGNRIGGLTAASRNVISGNTTAEIQLNNLATGNEIWGNYIGTNPAGTAAMSTSSVAISINGASGNFIGSTTTASRNVIVGPVTGQGIGIQIVGANNNRITNNWLGVDASGTTPLGYFSSAISLQNSAGRSLVRRRLVPETFWYSTPVKRLPLPLDPMTARSITT